MKLFYTPLKKHTHQVIFCFEVLTQAALVLRRKTNNYKDH